MPNPYDQNTWLWTRQKLYSHQNHTLKYSKTCLTWDTDTPSTMNKISYRQIFAHLPPQMWTNFSCKDGRHQKLYHGTKLPQNSQNLRGHLIATSMDAMVVLMNKVRYFVNGARSNVHIWQVLSCMNNLNRIPCFPAAGAASKFPGFPLYVPVMEFDDNFFHFSPTFFSRLKNGNYIYDIINSMEISEKYFTAITDNKHFPPVWN